MQVDGELADFRMGGSGVNGDIFLFRKTGNRLDDSTATVRIDGGRGNAWLGGNGTDGDVLLFPTNQGLDGLLSALGGGQHQRYVDEASSLGLPGTIDDGNGILGHVFGNKEVSRQVANRAAAQTGIGADVLRSMLPVVAAMMMGSMSKQVSPPGLQQAGVGSGGDTLLGMLTPMLDSNRDGSVVDDVIGMIGRFAGGR